jgi:hypothetical protein
MNTKSPISLLQEYCQAHQIELPQYSWSHHLSSEPGHAVGDSEARQILFTCCCQVKGDQYISKPCSTKSAAKTAAAELAYEAVASKLDFSESLILNNNDSSQSSMDEYFCNETRALVIVDLENLPAAGKVRYPKSCLVYFVLSHNHAFYCSPAGKFLEQVPPNIQLRVIKSSLRDAADHYLTWLTAELFFQHGAKYPFVIVSRDIAGACTKDILSSQNQTTVHHVTNVSDLEALFEKFI